ncbi:MAG: hypothetical protein Q4E74_05330 [Ruminococcus sp.]|nr:hypothetical protein [Ruminococcus sp.]
MKTKLRRTMLAAVLCAALLTCSCGGDRQSVKPEAIPEDFSKSAEITLDDNTYCADLRRGGDDIWECEFTSPETIEGLKITCSGDLCTLDFKELSYTLDRADVPQYSVVALVTKTVENLISGKELSCTESNGTVTERGIVNGEDFTAVIKKGELTEITVAQNFTVKFS